MLKAELKRLDILIFERGLARSREEAQALILAGSVWTGQTRLEKAGQKVAEDVDLEIRSRTPAFSSRGGHKLEHALESFQIAVSGRCGADIGASTGGFTDCLLKRGAARVLAIDVGYGQLDSKLRSDPRVLNLEKTNARYLTVEQVLAKDPNFPIEKVSLVAVDLSFISLRKVVPALLDVFRHASDWIFLFKPQFEVGREFIGKGGVVRDEGVVANELEAFQAEMKALRLVLKNGPESSPLPGKKRGNLEYLLHYDYKS
jgi:23S rRNA (cytidine1920-2'-O)/16S rRNA (cytidine1409-2'-O)-methyltransferase